MNNIYLHKLKVKHVWIILLSMLSITLIGILAIDILDIMGVRTALFNRDFSMPFFWFHWYRNGGPIEFVQYSFLGIAALYAAKNSITSEPIVKKFWSLLSVGLLYMLIEDAGDIRHFIRDYINLLAGESHYGILGTITELVYFVVLASIPLYAYFKYGRHFLNEHKVTRNYLMGGISFYALAGGSSFLGSAFGQILGNDLYTFLGNRLVNIIVQLGGSEVDSHYLGINYNRISFHLLDSPYEETLELIGGSLFLAAALTYLGYQYKMSKTNGDTNRNH